MGVVQMGLDQIGVDPAYYECRLLLLTAAVMRHCMILTAVHQCRNYFKYLAILKVLQSRACKLLLLLLVQSLSAIAICHFA